ncbi:MAG: universal stress protein [Rubrobacteraceae bacterium]
MSIFPAKILLAIDGSEESVLAARTAADLTDKTDSELHMVHVGEVPFFYHPEMHDYKVHDNESEEEAQQLLADVRKVVEAAGESVHETHLCMGRPDEEVVALAEKLEADLIVIGCRGFGGMSRALIGSVSDSVVRHAHCPVMVVRH